MLFVSVLISSLNLNLISHILLQNAKCKSNAIAGHENTEIMRTVIVRAYQISSLSFPLRLFPLSKMSPQGRQEGSAVLWQRFCHFRQSNKNWRSFGNKWVLCITKQRCWSQRSISTKQLWCVIHISRQTRTIHSHTFNNNSTAFSLFVLANLSKLKTLCLLWRYSQMKSQQLNFKDGKRGLIKE